MTHPRGPASGHVAGHAAVRASHGSAPSPHDALGNPLPRQTAPEPGHAKCSCGEVSRYSCPTGNARQRWHTRHKEEAAMVPWSDAAMRRDYA